MSGPVPRPTPDERARKKELKREACAGKAETGKSAVSKQDKWASNETAWAALNAEEEGHKVIFDRLEVAADGGMSEIGHKPELWYCTRYLSSVIVLVFVGYNIYFVASTDIDVLLEDGAHHCKNATAKDTAVRCYFYLSTSLIRAITGVEFGYATQLICGMELAILGLCIGRIFYRMYEIACHAGYVRWHAASVMCWEDLPDISYFSAMMLLNFITPQVLSEDFNYALWYVTPNRKRLLGIAWIVITRPLALFIGLDCFLLKVRSAHATLFADNFHIANVLATIVLLNQIVGVVQLRWAVQGRLYRFVFAGEDGVMTKRECVRMRTWNAMVAELIWQRYSTMQAVALMLTWNTDDFQLLVLNEREDEQSAVAGCELTPTASGENIRVSLVSAAMMESLEGGAAASG